MKYPKIQTLFKRDMNNKNRIIEGDFSKMEFTNIMSWIFTEKIDGTNIRITYTPDNEVFPKVKFDGRTDEADIPKFLLEALAKIFTIEKLESAFAEKIPQKVILFGEGYGPKIQKGGGLYRDDAGFILFDVWVDGWWLDRPSVEDIAKNLDIKVVPIMGIGSIKNGVEMVKSAPLSLVSKQPKVIEGIVARSYPLVLFRDGTPLVWKLKVRDYEDLKKE